MRYRFLAPARDELEEAVEFYNLRREHLGDEFTDEVEHAVARILAHPRAWPEISPRTRRCRTRRFPYGVIYQIRSDEILIVAIMHLRRKPFYWKNRLRS
jgi:plasmid stabilization system protein ParE